MKNISLRLILAVIFFAGTLSSTADSAVRKKDPRARLDEVYSLLIKANSDVNRGKEIQGLRGFLLGREVMLKIKTQNPDFEPNEVDDIIRVLDAQINVFKGKVQKEGLIEYRGKTLTFDQFKKLIIKEEERRERWERFQKYQEEERRMQQERRFQEEMRRQAEQKRLQDDMRRQAEIKRMQDDMRRQSELMRLQQENRRQAEERREAEERRRRYEEQQRKTGK